MNERGNCQDQPLIEDRLGERARVYGSERAILVGLQTPREPVTNSLRELESLAHTAGISTLAYVDQKRMRPHPSYFIGKGKVGEVKAAVSELDANVVIFARELSPAQARNLETEIGTKVIDRSQLIMDIFAQRAATKEAKLQVEIAQLRYLLPRLRGWGSALTRLGGGIGTRGPGETQLELDRNRIKHRIHTIERSLVKAKAERALRQKKRKASSLPQIVLVGYTNSGKSTLLNRLCNANALVENKLFATLSTTVRRGKVGSGRWALFVDTVGFIRNLPHHLIPAFAATLEAVHDANLILHVIDLASSSYEEDYRAVVETLNQEVFTTEGSHPPILDVLNKVDLIGTDVVAGAPFHSGIQISAKVGKHIDDLLHRIRTILAQDELEVSLLVPYAMSDLLYRISKQGRGIIKGYVEKGIKIEAFLSAEELSQLRKVGVRIIACSSSQKEGSSPRQRLPRSALGHR